MGKNLTKKKKENGLVGVFFKVTEQEKTNLKMYCAKNGKDIREVCVESLGSILSES